SPEIGLGNRFGDDTLKHGHGEKHARTLARLDRDAPASWSTALGHCATCCPLQLGPFGPASALGRRRTATHAQRRRSRGCLLSGADELATSDMGVGCFRNGAE